MIRSPRALASARRASPGEGPTRLKLLAISDLHVGHEANRGALAELAREASSPEDWLVVAGDVGETEAHLRFAWDTLVPRFAKVLWVPGNHELWTAKGETARGLDKYARLVELCRESGVVTPEDPYPRLPGPGPRTFVVPLFLLYDYSFRPDSVPEGGELAWAAESGIGCADEALLNPHPFASKEELCAARCAASEARLEALLEAEPGARMVLVNHFPLRREHAVLPRIPRFSIWCGTRRTEDWHARFRATAVVSGHLHIAATTWRDGVRFEEVSLGYPAHWTRRRAPPRLREILPGPPPREDGTVVFPS